MGTCCILGQAGFCPFRIGLRTLNPSLAPTAAGELAARRSSCWGCSQGAFSLMTQDRAAHFEREFGADGGGLHCEALVAAAKAAMARAVALAAVPGPEHDHLRRGRGRWHRSRLYHAMRQVRRSGACGGTASLAVPVGRHVMPGCISSCSADDGKSMQCSMCYSQVDSEFGQQVSSDCVWGIWA